MEGIPQHRQELVYDDKILHGSFTVADYGINAGTTLQLVECDNASSISSDEAADEVKKCIACGGKNDFYMVTPACRHCTVQQSRELDQYR